MSASATAPTPSNAKLMGSRKERGEPSSQCWDAALFFISQWICGANWKCSEDYMILGSHEIGTRLVCIEQGLHCIRIKLPAGNLQQVRVNFKYANFSAQINCASSSESHAAVCMHSIADRQCGCQNSSKIIPQGMARASSSTLMVGSVNKQSSAKISLDTLPATARKTFKVRLL